MVVLVPWSRTNSQCSPFANGNARTLIHVLFILIRKVEQPRAEIRRITSAETAWCTRRIFSCTMPASSCRKSSSTGPLRLCTGSAHANRHGTDGNLTRIHDRCDVHGTEPRKKLERNRPGRSCQTPRAERGSLPWPE